jgi:hypothetical protein
MDKLYSQNVSLVIIHNQCETIWCQPKEKGKSLFTIERTIPNW